MTILDPASLPPEHAADPSASGERVDLPPSMQALLRSVVHLMKAGQKVTLFPALAGQGAIERMQALDDLAREAYALGLYDRNVPTESN